MRFARGSSLGFLGRFGRSSDLRQLDEALRAVDVHPRLVSEAIKLTVARLLKEDHGDAEPESEAYRRAAELIGYCAVGADGFAATNDDDLAQAVEQRIEAALDAPDSLDARLVLLTIHAKAIQPSVVAAFGLESA